MIEKLRCRNDVDSMSTTLLCRRCKLERCRNNVDSMLVNIVISTILIKHRAYIDLIFMLRNVSCIFNSFAHVFFSKIYLARQMTYISVHVLDVNVYADFLR